MRIGLLGGTGPEGRGIALRWALAGADVSLGSRSIDRARAAAEELDQLIGRNCIRPVDNRVAAAESDLIVLTVPFEHAPAMIEAHNDDLKDGAILIDTTVPVTFEKGRPRYVELPQGSGSEHLRTRLKASVQLTCAFKTIPAHLLSEPHEALDCDEFIAGDSREARERVIEAVGLIRGLRPIDAGPLENARTLERMTLLAIGINRRYKIKTGRYRFVGL